MLNCKQNTELLSQSLERPITICLSFFRGNSPPWYLPEMNFRAKALPAEVALTVAIP